MQTNKNILYAIALVVAIVTLGVVVDRLESTVIKQNQIIEDYKKQQKQLDQKIQDLSKTLSTTQQVLDKAASDNTSLNEKIKRLEDENSKAIKIPSLSRGGDYSHAVATVYAKATAYGSSKLNGGDGTNQTKLGTPPQQGRTIAVDPDLIPLGSRVYVYCKDYPQINGVHIAEDTGGAIHGNRVDVYFDDVNISVREAHKTMDDFGVRDIILYVLSD